MLKKFVYGLFLFTGFFIATSGVHDIQSNGAPIASTNAPGETTCNRSGCHTGSPLNSDSGILSIEMNDEGEAYIPGNTYDITVSLAQPGIERFGFQMLALFDSDSANAGTFVATDDVRTKVLSGTNQYTGRQYMTYKFPGTEPYSQGEGRWSFQWIAPQEMKSSVTFYAAAAAANNDFTDDGDLIYTKQFSRGTVTSTSEIHKGISAHVFPNPAANELRVSYTVAEPGVTSFFLMDALSRKTELLLQRNDNPGQQTAEIDLKGKFSSGLYFLTVERENDRKNFKLILQH